MEPIPYYFDSINRNAIILNPRKPFFDWLNSVYSEDEKVEELDDPNIYLVKSMDSEEHVMEWLKKNYHSLFENELNDWVTNMDDWPEKRTWKLFQDWFEVKIHSMVLDVEDEPVEKD